MARHTYIMTNKIDTQSQEILFIGAPQLGHLKPLFNITFVHCVHFIKAITCPF